MLKQAAKSSKASLVLREHSEGKQTIENDNYASNMLIMNPDLPLHETYPFARAAQKVATALEPHMLKETAFSDASNLPAGRPSQTRAVTEAAMSNSLEGGGTMTQQILQERLRNEANLLTSSGQLTAEPSIQDKGARVLNNEEIA